MGNTASRQETELASSLKHQSYLQVIDNVNSKDARLLDQAVQSINGQMR